MSKIYTTNYSKKYKTKYNKKHLIKLELKTLYVYKSDLQRQILHSKNDTIESKVWEYNLNLIKKEIIKRRIKKIKKK